MFFSASALSLVSSPLIEGFSFVQWWLLLQLVMVVQFLLSDVSLPSLSSLSSSLICTGPNGASVIVSCGRLASDCAIGYISHGKGEREKALRWQKRDTAHDAGECHSRGNMQQLAQTPTNSHASLHTKRARRKEQIASVAIAEFKRSMSIFKSVGRW